MTQIYIIDIKHERTINIGFSSLRLPRSYLRSDSTSFFCHVSLSSANSVQLVSLRFPQCFSPHFPRPLSSSFSVWGLFLYLLLNGIRFPCPSYNQPISACQCLQYWIIGTLDIIHSFIFSSMNRPLWWVSVFFSEPFQKCPILYRFSVHASITYVWHVSACLYSVQCVYCPIYIKWGGRWA